VCCASLRLRRYGLFYNKTSFNNDISDWNVASVITMFRLFQLQMSFNQNVGGWNVASVTDLTNTFNSAYLFDHDISRCVEPQRLNSVDRKETFCLLLGCSRAGPCSAEPHPGCAHAQPGFQPSLGGPSYSPDLTEHDTRQYSAHRRWNVARVANLYGTFYAAKTFNQNIRGWNVASVVNLVYTFGEASAFNKNIARWNVLRVTSYSSTLWSGASALSDCNKKAIHTSWGSTFRTAYPTFNVATCTITPLTDANIDAAVSSWISSPSTAATTYGGSIGEWNVAAVSNM
jgi:surface protein